MTTPLLKSFSRLSSWRKIHSSPSASTASGSSVASVAAAAAVLAAVFLVVAGLGCRDKKSQRNDESGKSPKTKNDHRSGEQKKLKIEDGLITSPGEPSPKSTFSRGDKILCAFHVSGFKAPRNRLHLISEIKVQKKTGEVILRKGPEKAIDSFVPKGKSAGRVRVEVDLVLSVAAADGDYIMEVQIVEAGTKRRGNIRLPFVVRGPAFTDSKKLEIHSLRIPPEEDLPVGGDLTIDTIVKGFDTKDEHPTAEPGRPRWKIHLGFKVVLKDKDKNIVLSKDMTLAETTLPFKPAFLPLRADIPLSGDPGAESTLKEGEYELHLTLVDRTSGAQAQMSRELKLSAPEFGVYGLRIEDRGDVFRDAFYRNEWMTIKFYAGGYALPADISGDIALEGPGGVYLMKRNAIVYRNENAKDTTDKPLSRDVPQGHKAHKDANQETPAEPSLQIRSYAVPLRIPEFIPPGEFRVHIKLRDKTQKKEVIRSIPFNVKGKKIPPLQQFAMTALELRTKNRTAQILKNRIKGGEEIIVSGVVGGFVLDKKKPVPSVEMDLVMNIRLRNTRGELIHQDKGVARIKRRLTFLPLRLRLQSVWRVPSINKTRGNVLLQVEIIDLITDRVTMRQRKVFIHP